MSETHDDVRFSEDRLKILRRLELSDIHGMIPIQTDQQIGGHTSWLHTHDGNEVLKVLHKVIPLARRQRRG